MKLHNLICKGCGFPFQDRKLKAYCRHECRCKLSGWTSAQIRFHIMRAGSRNGFLKYLNINNRTLYQARDIQDVDRLHNGQMVSIGGILVRRCPQCEVARPLEHYWANDNNVCGVTGLCEYCRITKHLKSDKELVH